MVKIITESCSIPRLARAALISPTELSRAVTIAAYFCLCGLLIKLNFWREWRKQTEEDVKFNFTTLMLTARMCAVNRMWPYDFNTEVPVAQWVGLDGSQRRVTMTHDATKIQLKFISFYTSQTQFIHTLFTHHHTVFLVTWTRSSGAWRGSFLLAECTAWWAKYKNIGLETSWALIFFIASCVNSSVP